MSAQTARREPRSPWAVHSGGEIHGSFRSQRAAYSYVADMTGLGHAAEVWHWECGQWVLYERIDAPVPGDTDTKASDQ